MSLGLIGGGGSILTVPILVYFFQIDAVLATGYSLLIVGLTSAFGAGSYARQRLLRLKTGLIFGIPSLIGVSFARAFLVPALPNPVFSVASHPVPKGAFLMIAFALLMIAAASSMLRSAMLPQAATGPQSNTLSGGSLNVVFLGILVGCLTGFLGAGGGFLIVPVLTLILKMPIKVAIGTSLFIIAISSLTGFAIDLVKEGQMRIDFLLLVSLISVGGIGAGARLAKYISNSMLKKGFGYLVLAVGWLILVEQTTSIL